MTETYRVDFVVYQYNSGAADNGYYRCHKTFNDKDQAVSFAVNLREMLINGDNTREWASHYVYDGYLVNVSGITRIAEEQVEWQKQPWLPFDTKLASVLAECFSPGLTLAYDDPKRDYVDDLVRQGYLSASLNATASTCTYRMTQAGYDKRDRMANIRTAMMNEGVKGTR